MSRQRLSLLLASAVLLPAGVHADPQLTSWFTENSGKYARVYTTTANRTSGTAATTWNTSGSTLPHTLPAYSDVYEVWYSNSWVYTKYTGLPSYVIGPWLNPQGAVGNFWPGTQSVIRRFPRSPSEKSGTKSSTAAGTSGIFVNGVAAFNALDGQAWDGSQIQGQAQHTNGTYYWHRVAPVAESYNFDYALGHQLPAGLYHNHQNPIALRYQLGDHVDYNASTKNYSESATAVTAHSPVLGFAHDGYPIYGPYGYSTATDSASGVRRMVSGFVKRNGGTTGVDTVTSNTTTMPAWYLRYRAAHNLGGTTNPVSVARSTNTATYPIGTFAQDWAYLGDLIKSGSTYYAKGTDFDLDEYNGRYCVTPEYPNGTYAYFIAIDSSGAATYPYVFNFEFYGTASGGTVTSITESVTNHQMGGAATALAIPDTPAVSDGTVTLTWNSVEGGTYAVDASTDQSTWTSKATGVSATTNATSTSGTYTALGDGGTEYARVRRTALASYDVPSVASTVTVSQTATKSYLAGANTAPTLTTINTLTGASKNAAFTIGYDTLAAAADEADANGDAISFRVEGVGSGTLTKNGSAVTAGSTLVASGDSLVWTPATDVTGTVEAFTVRAWDGMDTSSSAIAVNVTVAATVTATADARLTSWYTAQTGKYARVVETDSDLLADSTKTTWTRTTGNFTLTQALPAYAGPQQIDYSGTHVYLRTPSLGTYTMGPWYDNAARTTLFLNVPKNQGLIVKIPRTSTIPATKTPTAGYTYGGVIQGGIGYYVDGVAIFDPTDGFGYQNGAEGSPATGSWHRDAYVNEGITFDKSLAHQQNTGLYHNHANPRALRYQLGDAVAFDPATKEYSETLSPTRHSPVIGWMLDGLPVYGPYGYSSAMDSNSGVRRMIGGYVKRDGATTGVDNISTTGSTRTPPTWATRNGLANTNGPSVSSTYPFGRYIQDWAYLGDLTKSGSTKYQQGVDFDLNEYNVRYCVTPEFPDGTWAYFLNIDATGTPRFPYISNRWYYGTPNGGTVTSVSETVTNHFTGGANRPLTVADASVAGTSVTLTWNAVEGGTYSVDASTNNSTWTSKASALTVSNANTKSNTHTALGTSGTEYARVNRTALATYDSTGTVAATVSQTTTTSFDLGAANVAPTLTAVDELSGGTEDTPYTVTYEALAAAADEADGNGDAISFRVESVVSGTLTKDGQAVVPGATLLSSGESLVWTPAADANGYLTAFTVRAWDGALASAAAIEVKVNVAAVNDAPTLTTFATLTGGTEDEPYGIHMSNFENSANEADVDGGGLVFRIESVVSGTLAKNGTPVTPGVTTVAEGESVVWTPAANVNGVVAAFTVAAYDGELASSPPVTVNISLEAMEETVTFAEWAALSGLDGTTGKEAGFADDPDQDGVANALELVLGGSPLDPASGGAPVATVGAGSLTLEFSRSDASESAVIQLKVQTSTDLSNWTDYPVGAESGTEGGVTITVTENGEGDDTIRVSIPTSAATKLFTRLIAVAGG